MRTVNEWTSGVDNTISYSFPCINDTHQMQTQTVGCNVQEGVVSVIMHFQSMSDIHQGQCLLNRWHFSQCLQLFCDCIKSLGCHLVFTRHISGDTHLGGSSSLCQAPNHTESSPQVREVRRKKRVVLQRCRGLGLYMVRGSATVLILRETYTRC